MAALDALAAVEDSNLVWQRVNVSLEALEASGLARDSFRALKAHLAQLKGNPDLRFTAISAASLITADDGQSVGANANRIYGVFFKKQDDATDAFISIVDNGTDDNYYGGALTGSVRLQTASLEAEEEFIATYPKGLSMANGIRVVTTTAAAAGTTVSAAEADTVNGFIISGAA